MSGNDYNKGGMAIFLFGMIATCLFFIYIVCIHKHPSPDYLLNAPKEEAAAPAASGNLWESSPEAIAKGKDLFESNCTVCHGAEGKGDGPGGAALNPKPRNLVEGNWKKGGSPVALFNSISKGIPDSAMSPWGHLPLDCRWQLVHYVRSITKNAPAGTDAELNTYKAENK